MRPQEYDLAARAATGAASVPGLENQARGVCAAIAMLSAAAASDRVFSGRGRSSGVTVEERLAEHQHALSVIQAERVPDCDVVLGGAALVGSLCELAAQQEDGEQAADRLYLAFEVVSRMEDEVRAAGGRGSAAARPPPVHTTPPRLVSCRTPSDATRSASRRASAAFVGRGAKQRRSWSGCGAQPSASTRQACECWRRSFQCGAATESRSVWAALCCRRSSNASWRRTGAGRARCLPPCPQAGLTRRTLRSQAWTAGGACRVWWRACRVWPVGRGWRHR